MSAAEVARRASRNDAIAIARVAQRQTEGATAALKSSKRSLGGPVHVDASATNRSANSRKLRRVVPPSGADSPRKTADFGQLFGSDGPFPTARAKGACAASCRESLEQSDTSRSPNGPGPADSGQLFGLWRVFRASDGPMPPPTNDWST